MTPDEQIESITSAQSPPSSPNSSNTTFTKMPKSQPSAQTLTPYGTITTSTFATSHLTENTEIIIIVAGVVAVVILIAGITAIIVNRCRGVPPGKSHDQIPNKKPGAGSSMDEACTGYGSEGPNGPSDIEMSEVKPTPETTSKVTHAAKKRDQTHKEEHNFHGNTLKEDVYEIRAEDLGNSQVVQADLPLPCDANYTHMDILHRESEAPQMLSAPVDCNVSKQKKALPADQPRGRQSPHGHAQVINYEKSHLPRMGGPSRVAGTSRNVVAGERGAYESLSFPDTDCDREYTQLTPVRQTQWEPAPNSEKQDGDFRAVESETSISVEKEKQGALQNTSAMYCNVTTRSQQQ